MWRVCISLIFLCVGCNYSADENQNAKRRNSNALFKRLSSDVTGINFLNKVEITDDLDAFRYRNFYNGGGVGIGDINNDGLADVYLTSNMGDNKLFLNKGDWKFEDITVQAGVESKKVWSTGVSMADVNGDGLLDIYVCNAGLNGSRENELFINNGNQTFTESAIAYGLADNGYTTHAAFLDYDKDGDLDCYVLNNSFRPISTLGFRNLRTVRDVDGGDKLYRNDNGKFVDVSEQAGIFGSVIGFGLGVSVSDINQDNWPDLYVSNDFYERDYLYINKRDGTFSEELENRIGHLSMFSMGADMADMNNDGFTEIFATDMLPDDDIRLKTLSSFESFDVYQLRLKNGYYHQFMRNMLQVNNQDGTFSEIGELAGVAQSDWSWGALLADFNNDSNKEIFISNGIYKDLTNHDFMEFFGSSEQIQAALQGKKIDWKLFTDRMPSQKLSNYLFTRTGEWHYENVSEEWGLAEPTFSNGAAYGDLDNDGDLDLIINNVNQELFVYNNQTQQKLKNNYLKIRFKGKGKNSFGLGATVKVYVDSSVLTFQHMPIRGFQSSMDYQMVIGLGNYKIADSLWVVWPDDKVQVIRNVDANQLITLEQDQATQAFKSIKPVFNTQYVEEVKATPVQHIENDFNDFDRDRLLYHMLSTQGPAYAKADLNSDGLDDIFVGGSSGHAGVVYMQTQTMKFAPLATVVFQADSTAEDVSAAFFDADGDHDLDLYVVSGGSENLTQSPHVLDRLYENKGIKNGQPVFEKTAGKIPPFYQSGSCVKPADIDNDGDMDLFVGTRVIPSYYGVPCDQFILMNDGKGNFSNATAMRAPELQHLGMVTDAAWVDFDADGLLDLIVVGEWMPIQFFKNDGKRFLKVRQKELEQSSGWWNTIKAADIDQDGDMDFVLGNLGLNSKFQPKPGAPLQLYVNDFDRNGSIEAVFAYQKDSVDYPIPLRQDIIKQMSSLKKKFVYFKDYAGKSMNDIFDASLMENATRLRFNEPHTGLLVNEGSGTFSFQALPVEAQTSPVFGIEVVDINNDNHLDIVLGGNLFAVKPEIGRYDAMPGLVLRNDGKGNFESLNSLESGIKVMGEVRHISIIKSRNEAFLAFIRNNDSIKFYKLKK
ncbi:MAG TPA: VCBS repeat-containing protein [Ohtaekwangia sp.]|nr:VCBS repeat-containing protein [Ohtaekwangia sp.]